MNLLIFSALFFPVIISGFSFFFIKIDERFLKFILAFSGAYLLTISFIGIIPEIYSVENKNIIGLFILIGFFIQLLLDFITKGVEHGHKHIENNHHQSSLPSLLPLMIGICIHSFLEGMPLANNFSANNIQRTLLIGIVIHNIPISIVLMSILLQTKKKKILSIIQLLIFALSAPLGVLFCNYFGATFVDIKLYYDVIMAMVIGIFLHISTTILFESDQMHGFNFFKLCSILIGVITAYLID